MRISNYALDLSDIFTSHQETNKDFFFTRYGLEGVLREAAIMAVEDRQDFNPVKNADLLTAVTMELEMYIFNNENLPKEQEDKLSDIYFMEHIESTVQLIDHQTAELIQTKLPNQEFKVNSKRWMGNSLILDLELL